MKKHSKILCLMLSLIMVLSLVPTVAFATGDIAEVIGSDNVFKGKYATLQDAFNNVATGDTVKLLDDVTLTEQVNIKKALNGLTFDGNGKTVILQTTTDPSQPGGSGFYFGNPNESLWCTGIKIKDLTITGKARFGIFLSGGTVSEFTNVNISGEYLYAVNLYGTHGGTFTNCTISNSLDLDNENEDGAAIWSNVAADFPVRLVSSDLGIIGINKYTDANKLEPKIFVDEKSKVEVRTLDDGEVSNNPRLCVSPESEGTFVVKVRNDYGEWVVVARKAAGGGSSGISISYNGGNSFSTSKSDVPTSVEIDGVPVPFTGNGSNFTVGCIEPNAKWITVKWNSTSITTNFTPDGLAECTTVAIPKTGDSSNALLYGALMFVLLAGVVGTAVTGKRKEHN